MNKQQMIEKLNDVPFFNGEGSSTGEYDFSSKIEIPEEKQKDGNEDVIQSQIVSDIQNAVFVDMLNKHSTDSGDMDVMDSESFADIRNDAMGGMQYMDNAASILCMGSLNLDNPVAVTDEIKGKKTIDSTKLSVIDVKDYSYSFDENKFECSGKIIYTY